MAEQNFKNHARLVPAFHYGVFLMLLGNLVWSVYAFRYGFHGQSLWVLVTTVTMIVMALSLRGQILTVQDRVIRLEMRLRFSGVLPQDVAARAANLGVKQLVALRFASDAELPELVRDVLAGSLAEPKAIKMKIQQWEADHLRA
jgi:uncharacterized protein DUF6526